MLPAFYAILRTYVPYVTLPISIAIGIIGYNLEGLLSDKATPTKKKSIEEERLDRQATEIEDNSVIRATLKSKVFVPKTIFERNVSPSLEDK